jgi:hypothetical protein
MVFCVCTHVYFGRMRAAAAAAALNGLYDTVVSTHTKGLCRMSKDGEGEHVGLFALLEESVESNIETAVLTEYNGILSLSYSSQLISSCSGP